AIMLSLYGTVTFYEGQLLMMWLGALLNMLMLYVLHRAGDGRGIGQYILAGFLLGLSALARANVLVFSVVVLLWIALGQERSRRLVRAGVFATAMLVTILPATIHNYLAARDFVPITSNGGINFFIGNSEDAKGIFYPPRGVNLVKDSVLKTYVERLLGREVSDSEFSRYWFNQAFDFIRENPGREARLLARKTRMFFNAYEVPQIEAYEVARDRHSSLRVLFVSFWMILSLALMGMIYLVRDWKKYFLLYGYIITFSASIILFFITARYRVQIAPIFCLFAAHALLVIIPRAVSNIRHSLVPAIVFGLIVISTRPGPVALPKQEVEWREHAHQARRFSRLNKHEEAIQEINKAVELHPDYPDSYIQRAIIYKNRGNHFKAIDDYAKALQINPSLATVQYDLGQSLRKVRMYEPAIEAYLKALEADPNMIQAYNNIGITYRELKQYRKAVEYFEKVIEMDAGYTKAYNNLGAAWAELGDLDRAIQVFEKAIAIDPGYANSYKNLAIAHVGKQQVVEAVRALKDYLVLAPGDEHAQGILEQLTSVLRSDTLR
ncbi:MAG: tetratricopeptide repeat protein, partial [Methyloligellaceae bacterium]